MSTDIGGLRAAVSDPTPRSITGDILVREEPDDEEEEEDDSDEDDEENEDEGYSE